MKRMTSAALTVVLTAAGLHFTAQTLAQSPDAKTQTSASEPYRFRPKMNASGTTSLNIEIEESKDGIDIKGLGNNSKVASAIPFDGKGRARYMVDAPGSRDIRIVVNPKVGYTTFAGLRFQDAAVAAVRKDGLVVVNKEGIRARDSSGRLFVSAKLVVGGKPETVMVEKK